MPCPFIRQTVLPRPFERGEVRWPLKNWTELAITGNPVKTSTYSANPKITRIPQIR